MKKDHDIQDDDFGFSFVDDDYNDIKKTNESNQEVIDDLTARLDSMYNAIIPFLDNLCKNPEKSTIHWPNRVERIAQFKEKLAKVREGSDSKYKEPK